MTFCTCLVTTITLIIRFRSLLGLARPTIHRNSRPEVSYNHETTNPKKKKKKRSYQLMCAELARPHAWLQRNNKKKKKTKNIWNKHSSYHPWRWLFILLYPSLKDNLVYRGKAHKRVQTIRLRHKERPRLSPRLSLWRRRRRVNHIWGSGNHIIEEGRNNLIYRN